MAKLNNENQTILRKHAQIVAQIQAQKKGDVEPMSPGLTGRISTPVIDVSPQQEPDDQSSLPERGSPGS